MCLSGRAEPSRPVARAVCESTARTGGERPYHGRTQRRGCARVAVAFGFVPRALSRSLVGCGARSRRGQRRHWPIVVVALWTVFRSAPWSRRRRCVGRVLHPTLAVQPSLVSSVCVCGRTTVCGVVVVHASRVSLCVRRRDALVPSRRLSRSRERHGGRCLTSPTLFAFSFVGPSPLPTVPVCSGCAAAAAAAPPS